MYLVLVRCRIFPFKVPPVVSDLNVSPKTGPAFHGIGVWFHGI